MKKNTAAFGGFEELVGALTIVEKPIIPKVNDDDDDDDSTDDDVDPKEIEPVEEPPVGKTSKTIEDDKDDDEGDDDDDTPGDDDKDDDDTTDISEVEPEISSYFADSLISRLGVEVDDKAKKFEKVDDVIELMTDIIKANSRPEYANEEVAKFDEYVRNGGDLKKFYDEVYKDSIDISKVDIEDEKDQKLVIESNLRNLGYKEERIKKVISRYEDAEVLKDEAEDALEQIKDYQEKKSKRLLADQENHRIGVEKENKAFYDSVVDYVNTLKDISGVSLDSNAKKEIIDYIFRVSPDGATGFQKAYASNAVKNLVETAYFIHPKYRETLLSKTSKKATDDAMKKVRDKLKASKGKRNSGSGSGLGKASPNFSSLSGLIIK